MHLADANNSTCTRAGSNLTTQNVTGTQGNVHPRICVPPAVHLLAGTVKGCDLLRGAALPPIPQLHVIVLEPQLQSEDEALRLPVSTARPRVSLSQEMGTTLAHVRTPSCSAQHQKKAGINSECQQWQEGRSRPAGTHPWGHYHACAFCAAWGWLIVTCHCKSNRCKSNVAIDARWCVGGCLHMAAAPAPGPTSAVHA
jgi:hypothetical protein